MEYPLSITRLIETPHDGRAFRSPLTSVMADADLGPFAHFGSPEFFFGKLVEASGHMIQDLANAPEVEVSFRGERYLFEILKPTGFFKLVRTR